MPHCPPRGTILAPTFSEVREVTVSSGRLDDLGRCQNGIRGAKLEEDLMGPCDPRRQVLDYSINRESSPSGSDQNTGERAKGV